MKTLFTAFTLLLIVSLAAAQDDACPAIVETALENASTLCLETGRNQVCYGNVLVNVEGDGDFTFEEPGNMVDVGDISGLTLSGLDEENNHWGIALMRLQANLPETLPGQNVTVLAFGDVQLTADEAAPMQAFYFQSGIGEAACAEAPDGILVQTPDGAATVDLTINGIDIQLGSTAFIQAQSPEALEAEEGLLTLSLLEGQAVVTVGDESVTVETGSQTRVALDEDLNASGAPSEPEPFDASGFEGLPLNLLEREVELETADSGISTNTGGGVIPRSGSWLYTIGTATAEGCPPGMAEAMAAAGDTPPTTTDIAWGESFTAESLMSLNDMGVLPEGMTITQPEPDVIRMTIAVDESSSTVMEYRLVSETLIEISISTTMLGSCVVTIPATMEYQG